MNHSTEEAAYLQLANSWRRVHRTESNAKWPTVLVSIAALLVLSPVIGMVLVFAVIPMLPVALLLGIVLGPMNLFTNREREDEDAAVDLWEQRRSQRALEHAHA